MGYVGSVRTRTAGAGSIAGSADVEFPLSQPYLLSKGHTGLEDAWRWLHGLKWAYQVVLLINVFKDG